MTAQRRHSTCLVAAALALAALMPGAPGLAADPSADVKPTARSRAHWFDRYSQERDGPEESERFSQTYRVGRDAALDLTNLSGDVRVTGGSGSEIRIEAIKRVRHRDAAEAKRQLGQLRIEVSQVGSRLEVRTVYPRHDRVRAHVDYTVAVPDNAAAAVKTVSGNVTISSVTGEVRAETVSGDVSVSRTPNLAHAKAVSGNVTAKDIGAQNPLMLSTVSGTLVATSLKARGLDASTVSGNVQLSDVQVERLQAKSVSGNLHFEGQLREDGRYSFNSHSGNVRLFLTGNTGFELDADTFSGSIRSDFPVTLRANTEPDKESRRANARSRSQRTIRGTFGNGSAVLAVRSFSGTVVVAKK